MAKKISGGSGFSTTTGGSDSGGSTTWKSNIKVYETGTSQPRCWESHPVLPLRDGLVITGGSCITPISSEFDIFVGLDSGMKLTGKSFPWMPGHEFLYRITDREAPKNPEAFKSLIEWMALELVDEKTIHVGCIGGHGRTGVVLSALVAFLEVSDDPIAYVRSHYCKRAVESEVQIAFLKEHFGCKVAEPSKPKASSGKWSTNKAGKGIKLVSRDEVNKHGKSLVGTTATPYPATNCVWGSALKS